MIRIIVCCLIGWSLTAGPLSAAESTGKLVYAGATGSIGRLALPQLLEQGYSIRAITRNPARASKTAAARPFPIPSAREPPPVTSATLPANLCDSRIRSISSAPFTAPAMQVEDTGSSRLERSMDT